MRKLLITGGSSGIGTGLVQKYLDDGYEVHIISSKKHENQKNIFYYQVDLSKDFDTSFLENIGEIDTFIHSAGKSTWGSVQELDICKEREVFELNFLSLYKFLLHFVKAQEQIKHIVLISSTSSVCPLKNQLAYSKSKMSVNYLHFIFFKEFRAKKTYMTLVIPSSVDTPYWEGSNLNVDSKLPLGIAVERIYHDLKLKKKYSLPSKKAKLQFFLMQFLPITLFTKNKNRVQRI